MHGTRKSWSVALTVDRRASDVALAGTLLGLSSGLRAQGPTAPRRIGYLSSSARPDSESLLNLLRQELEKLAWADGRNILLLEPRAAEGRNERLTSMAAELVTQSPDIVLVQSVPATLAPTQATTTIPIVMNGAGNPVELGIVADFARPGGNVTGSSYLADESLLKTLELLKEAAPRLRSVAVFSNPSNEAAAPMIKRMPADVAGHGMRMQVAEVSGPGDFERAFAAIGRDGTESILPPPEALIRTNRAAIADFAFARKLPLAIVGSSRYLPAHGLMSYGPTTTQHAQLTARYVDPILKGANPADLPAEQPSRFELAINLKTAQALCPAIPESLLAPAEEVIQ